MVEKTWFRMEQLVCDAEYKQSRPFSFTKSQVCRSGLCNRNPSVSVIVHTFLCLHFLWHYGIFKSGLDGTDLPIWLQLNLVLWTLWGNTEWYVHKVLYLDMCHPVLQTWMHSSEPTGPQQGSAIENSASCSDGVDMAHAVTYWCACVCVCVRCKCTICAKRYEDAYI